MARVNRLEVLAEGEIKVVHCVNRCVRRVAIKMVQRRSLRIRISRL